jgi:hypothetical protein
MEMTSAGIGSLFSNSHSVFVVAKASTGALNNTGSHIQVLFTTSGTNSTVAFSGSHNATGIYMHNYVGTGTNYISTITAYTQGTWQLMNRVMEENASGTSLFGYVNGSLIGTSNSALQMKNYTNVIRLGASSTSGTYPYPLNGDIAEIITFTGTLNDAQRTIVDSYLAAKYNLTIADDKYLSNDASYILDVHGIGTSDGSMENKHSIASSSKGLLLEEANSSLNAADEFILAGHATSNNATVGTDLPLSVSERWKRDWYLEKTGAIDAKLSFDFSDAGIVTPINLGNDLSLYSLLYRSSPAGSFMKVAGNPVLVNGDQLSFTVLNDELLSGYYTVGFSPRLVWTGSENEEWNNGANWNLNRVPTSDDLVIVNTCTTCPVLSSSANIAGFELNGGRVKLNDQVLLVSGFTSINNAQIESDHGKIQSIDFAEIKNSDFRGAIILEKTGGSTNSCYGGNTFSVEVKVVNSSVNAWEVAREDDNKVIKVN